MCRWFETISRPLWRHCNGLPDYISNIGVYPGYLGTAKINLFILANTGCAPNWIYNYLYTQNNLKQKLLIAYPPN